MGVRAFPKGIYLKVNAIAQLEFELVCFDAKHIGHNVTGTSPDHMVINNILKETSEVSRAM